jgi:hypothetical protein
VPYFARLQLYLILLAIIVLLARANAKAVRLLRDWGAGPG